MLYFLPLEHNPTHYVWNHSTKKLYSTVWGKQYNCRNDLYELKRLTDYTYNHKETGYKVTIVSKKPGRMFLSIAKINHMIEDARKNGTLKIYGQNDTSNNNAQDGELVGYVVNSVLINGAVSCNRYADVIYENVDELIDDCSSDINLQHYNNGTTILLDVCKVIKTQSVEFTIEQNIAVKK